MLDAWWFWLFVAVMVFWSVGAYRRLVGLRTAVNKQFAVLEELMLRYQALVQEATTAAVTSPSGWQTAVSPELGASHWTRFKWPPICRPWLWRACKNTRLNLHPPLLWWRQAVICKMHGKRSRIPMCITSPYLPN